ncbi:MAG: thioredoxin family protein [Spirochaetales bacterium]|nr:thioredoxin family protein [Spirochaetales bacterium]
MRNNKILFFTVLLILLAIYVYSGDNPTEAIDIQLRKEYQIPDTGSILIDITVIIPKGNHIYIDHKDKESASILSEFTIPDASGVVLLETIKPVGEVFKGDIIIKGRRIFQLRLENTKKREDGEKIRVPFEFKVQMCNDATGVCYFPYTFKKEMSFVFLKRSKAKRTATSKDGINWVYKHAEGLDEARRLNKNLFVLITAPDWCGPCRNLEETTLQESTVIDFLNTNFIPVQIRDTINGERNPELWTYDFEGYPTYLVATPEQEVLYQDAGTISAPAFLSALKEYEIEVEKNTGRLLTPEVIEKITCAVRYDESRGLGLLNDGNYVIFKVDDETMSNKYPLLISGHWKDLLPYKDKIVTGLNYMNGKYYFFLSDNRYLRFSEASLTLDPGYPKNVDYKSWPGLDSYIPSITASFAWKKNNKAYFFLNSGNYIRYDIKTSKIDPGYPAKITETTWPGLGPYSSRITSAYSDGTGFTYFTLNTGTIVQYDEMKDKVAEGPVDESGGGEVVKADDSTFYPLTGNKLAFVDFYADWCGPCMAFAPVFEDIAKTLPGGLFIKVDVDTCPVLCNDYAIEWIPYVVALYNGKVIEEAPRDKETFITWAETLMKKY